MMKSSKVILRQPHHNTRMHKPSRLSPMRKDLMMKKPSHSSSMRMNVPARPPPMKHHLSPGMKRSPNTPPGKSMHSQRLRSIPSSPHRSLPRQSLPGPSMPMDRGHPMKSSKFEKRRHSPSPIHHPLGPSSHSMKEPVMYQDERYLRRPMPPPDSRFSPPMKKSRWESDDRYERGLSPSLRMMNHPEMAHSESRMAPHRSGMPSHTTTVPSIPNPSHRNHMPMSQHDRSEPYDMHSRNHPSMLPAVPASHSKRPPSSSMKQSYKDSHQERYRSPTPDERYLSPKDKHYYSSLHERFSSVNNEPRIKYCLEELETITVDVHPPTIDSPRSRRHINNQSSGKIVRRTNDGHRSMFDRDEIKQASRDMREDAYYEKRSSNVAYGSMSVVKGVGKYEVRQKFDSHSTPFHSTGGVSPEERWQEDQRRESMNMDRDHREYERTVKKRFVDSRSKSGDQDFRSETYSRDASRERPGYHSPHRMPSPDHRSSMPPIHRKEGIIQDARERLTARRGSGMKPHVSRSDSRGRYPSESEKHYADGLPSRADKHYMDRRSPETHKWPPKHRSESRERMPEYSRREEKYPPKSWPEKRDLSPRNTDFHLEPERYMESESYRGRGGSRPFRPREQRGRGSFSSRSFRGGYRSSTSARGRGAPRRGRYSPGIWERDL